MKNIGIVVAVETEAVRQLYGEPKRTEHVGVSEVSIYEKKDAQLFVYHCGPGEIASAAATQALISLYHCELIANFGVVGGLSEEMSEVPLAVVDKVVHYQFDTSEVDQDAVPGLYLGEYDTIYIPAAPELVEKAVRIEPSLKKVVCASGEKFVGTAEEKKQIHDAFHADICEMEAAGIVLTANRNHVPCILIKMVADSVHGGGDEYHRQFNIASTTCFRVLDRIIESL